MASGSQKPSTSAPGKTRSGQAKSGKPKKDRGAARRARAAAKDPSTPSSTRRTRSQDAANAWRQGISTATASAVDQMTAHVQAVVLDQLEQFGAFPPFVVVARRDGEFELHSLSPEELERSSPADALDSLRNWTRESAAELLGAALAFGATLPDRSGASALIAEVEHVDGVSLTVIQAYKVKGTKGAKRTELEDATVENREPSLLR